MFAAEQALDAATPRTTHNKAAHKEAAPGPPAPDPPAGCATVRGGARGFALVDGAWFNRARKGRPTLPEGLLAACCIVDTASREDQRQLLKAAALEQLRAEQMGDAWTQSSGDAWTTGGVVQSCLHAALSASGAVLLRAAHVLNQQPSLVEAGLEVSIEQLHTYLYRISDKRRRDHLAGPTRDSRGNSSPCWQAALPEIAELMRGLRSHLQEKMESILR